MSDQLTVLIVDDEPLARQKIERLLNARDEVIAIHQAEDGVAALELLETNLKPDIIFLDIEMPGLSGFEMLYHLPEHPFRIIFQTAYDSFAIQAFEANACDYILKPFTPARLYAALDRAQQQISLDRRIEELSKDLVRSGRYLESLSVQNRGVIDVIQTETIESFVSRDHYTCIQSKDGESLTRLSLDHLEERLNPDQFVRVHRSAIVNLKSVKRVDGSAIKLHSGQLVPLSRRNKPLVRAALSASR